MYHFNYNLSLWNSFFSLKSRITFVTINSGGCLINTTCIFFFNKDVISYFRRVETPLKTLLRGIKNPPKGPNDVVKYPWSNIFRISKTRCYFPRPSETKRVLNHGWAKRMSTPGGRRVIMNRILKGRHVLSH